MSQRVARRCPRARSSWRSSGYSKSSPLKATQIEPSSLAIGCRPPARSMIESRRAPRATPGSMWTCSSSGPRCAIAPVIASSRGRGKLARSRQIDRAGDATHAMTSRCQTVQLDDGASRDPGARPAIMAQSEQAASSRQESASRTRMRRYQSGSGIGQGPTARRRDRGARRRRPPVDEAAPDADHEGADPEEEAAGAEWDVERHDFSPRCGWRVMGAIRSDGSSLGAHGRAVPAVADAALAGEPIA